MHRWYQAIIVIAIASISVLSLSAKYAMSSDPHDNTSKYRVEYVSPENSKLKLSEEALTTSEQEQMLVATVKVARAEYVPAGIEIRTRISPSIFTANIPREILHRLEQDPDVVSIEPAYKLKSY
jgi:hypothetical protein